MLFITSIGSQSVRVFKYATHMFYVHVLRLCLQSVIPKCCTHQKLKSHLNFMYEQGIVLIYQYYLPIPIILYIIKSNHCCLVY